MNEKLKSITLIDDDEIICMVTKRLLEHMQVAEEVYCFSDSHKGLEAIKTKYAGSSAAATTNNGRHLILLDIDMPGFGGFEILRRLQELNSSGKVTLDNVSFAIVTSHKTNKEVALANQFGVTSILEKPLDQHDIRTVVQSIS